MNYYKFNMKDDNLKNKGNKVNLDIEHDIDF